MIYCPKCDIVIRGQKICCPLCRGKTAEVSKDKPVSEMADKEAFPVIERKISSVTFIKIVTFLFLTLEICFGVVYKMTDGAPWVGLVMLGIVVGWIDVLGAMYVRGNIIKLITVEAYVAIGVNIFVDYMTNLHGWSFAWVIPAILLGLLIVTIAIATVTGLRYNEYIQYLAYNTVVTLLQLIPIRMEINPLILPALISIAIYLILMAAVFVFRSRELKTALDRRFSV